MIFKLIDLYAAYHLLQDHERTITTAGDFLAGESLRRELNEVLSEAMGE